MTDAAATVLHAERGRIKQVAAALGLGDRAVYEVADINAPRALKAWWIPTICRVTQTFTLLDVLEAQVGRVAFPLVKVGAKPDEAQLALAREVVAFGEFLTETAQDMADNRIDQDELRRMLPAIDRVIARMCEFRETAIRKAALDAPQLVAAR